jgi:retron-type reverse transcriptase
MELLNKVLDYSNIDKAYKQVVGNKGSKGVDGVTTAQFQDYMQEYWGRIKQEIIVGHYPTASSIGS